MPAQINNNNIVFVQIIRMQLYVAIYIYIRMLSNNFIL